MTKQLNIFLIDDNDIDIVVNTKLLKLARITEEIRSFQGCQDALSWFMGNEDTLRNQTNVILLDIQMPHMDGFECMDHFSDMPEGLRKAFTVYMLSSSIDRKDISRAEEHPFVKRVLEKPLDVYLLKRFLEELH